MSAVNENYSTGMPLPDVVVGDVRLRMYDVPGAGLILDGQDVEAFFSREDLTAELVLALKMAVEERTHAWSQQTKVEPER